MRVYELAKELGISSKECLAKLDALGSAARSHMSALTAEEVDFLREEAGAAPAGPPPKAAQPAEETSAPEAEAQPEPSDRQAEAPPEATPAPAAVQPPDPQTSGKVIRIKGAVVVKELAQSLGLRPNQLITELMAMNVLASITQRVDVNTAKAIAEKHGFTLEHEKRAPEQRAFKKKAEFEQEEEPDKPEDLVPRAPVVTFLGHVDHGKTSLMDKIRDTTVVAGEHGGITQHIGAYTVDVSGRSITFLDTPGHAAFTAMRARGANLTDVAVIVIAADDGVMPQTREAVMHAQAAEVALIVAINKTDLPAANVDRVKQQLQAEGLAPEDWGGDVICCPVSAHTGEGIEHLLEMILLQADVLELTANPQRRARGFVIESQLEPGMGPTANLLVKNGTLKVGDTLLCSHHCGKVRALINDHGAKVKSAPPSTPVKCLGLSGVPEAGAEFRVFANEKAARSLAAVKSENLKQEQLAAPRKTSLDSLLQRIEDDKKLELKVILKADTQGSIEAIIHSLEEISSEKISLRFILSSTGNVTDNDVMLASASDAVILGFHVAKEPGVDAACRHEGVEVRLHQVIYELIDEVREAMTGLLKPELRKTVVGAAQVKQVFPLGKVGKVAGCMMTSGRATPRHRVRVKRGDEVLFEGGLASIKHFQDSVDEVREPQECGIRVDKFSEFEAGDILEFYEVEEIEQTL
jgi:translation initiation factor IF-2